MKESLQALTTFEVEDDTRPWGKVKDILMEYPSCKNRYLGVRAHIGAGVREIWAPVQAVCATDCRHRTLKLNSRIDTDLTTHLDRVNEPHSDVDELKLHRLYRTQPPWTVDHIDKKGKKKKFKLRRQSRLIRLSTLINWEVMDRQGQKGRVTDLLLDMDSLQTTGFEIYLDRYEKRFLFYLNDGKPFLLDRFDHALYVDSD